MPSVVEAATTSSEPSINIINSFILFYVIFFTMTFKRASHRSRYMDDQRRMVREVGLCGPVNSLHSSGENRPLLPGMVGYISVNPFQQRRSSHFLLG